MPCVKSPPRTWRRKGNALLRIASDPACSDGPFDKPKFNWINCVRGGRRYSLQAQGDFCGTAATISQSDSMRENTQEGRKSITLVSPISGSLPGMLHSYGSMPYPSRQPLALEWLRKTDRNHL